MKLRIQILIFALSLSLVALLFLAPAIAAILGIAGLATYCTSYAKEHGIGRALILFFKELLFGW
jgi:hypothetical protein